MAFLCEKVRSVLLPLFFYFLFSIKGKTNIEKKIRNSKLTTLIVLIGMWVDVLAFFFFFKFSTSLVLF